MNMDAFPQTAYNNIPDPEEEIEIPNPEDEIGIPDPEEEVSIPDPKEEIIAPEKEVVTLDIPILDRSLTRFGFDHEARTEFINEKKSLPSDAIVELYHGLNSNLEGALAVLESPEHGLKQKSGPCLSVYPEGGYWKPGDAGLRYSIPREKIELPGEINSGAQFRMDDTGTVFMVNGLDTLSFAEFDGEVVRTEGKKTIYEKDVTGADTDVEAGQIVRPLTDKEIEAGRKIEEKLKKFSGIRKTNSDIKRLQAEIQAL